jgi:hypothetical protein
LCHTFLSSLLSHCLSVLSHFYLELSLELLISIIIFGELEFWFHNCLQILLLCFYFSYWNLSVFGIIQLLLNLFDNSQYWINCESISIVFFLSLIILFIYFFAQVKHSALSEPYSYCFFWYKLLFSPSFFLVNS